MQKKIFLLLILSVMVIPVAFADNHDVESESLCGSGTYYDVESNSCILDTDDIPKFEEIKVPNNSTNTDIEQMNDIPNWVRGIFNFWVENKISDNELKEAIKFLVDTGIIVL